MTRIFDFETPHDFLQQYLETKPFSMRKLAEILGLRHHNDLYLCIKGKRTISPKIYYSLCLHLGFNELESRYFRKIIELTKCKKPDLEERLRKEISDIRVLAKDPFYLVYEPASLKALSPLLSTLSILEHFESFKEDPVWIQDKLTQNYNLYEVNEALQLLLQSERLPTNIESNTSDPILLPPNDIKHESIKKYHQDSLKLVADALENDEYEKREIQTLALPMDPSRISEAKIMIRQFLQSFVNHFQIPSTPSKVAVYQFSLNLVPITKPQETRKAKRSSVKKILAGAANY